MSHIHLETIQSRTLKHIDDVAPLSNADFAVLTEIGDVLRKHKVNDRFGVCLLHKHFELDEDEELFEETDAEKRISTVSVRARSDGPGSIETAWRFSAGPLSVTQCELRCNFNNGHKPVHVPVGR